jgi:hypothetical protein
LREVRDGCNRCTRYVGKNACCRIVCSDGVAGLVCYGEYTCGRRNNVALVASENPAGSRYRVKLFWSLGRGANIVVGAVPGDHQGAGKQQCFKIWKFHYYLMFLAQIFPPKKYIYIYEIGCKKNVRVMPVKTNCSLGVPLCERICFRVKKL